MDTNNSWILMILMASTLGLKHGFDLDHLATIDSITRTLRSNRFLSKIVGVLFSLGHGLVVIAISVIIGSGLVQTEIPEWLKGFGNWVSFTFLLLFGLLNLWNLFQNNSSMPVGIRSFLTTKIKIKSYSPAMIMLIGALFALSFDTFSQITLFSISGSLMSGWLFSGLLGLFFTFGMILSDGLNGLIVSHIVHRADKTSLLLSRGLGLAISLFSLTLAFITLLKLFS